LKIKSFDEVTANYEEKLALYPALQARVRTLERMLYVRVERVEISGIGDLI